jgi:branched-chain amino acid transport system ATP-binding protein
MREANSFSDKPPSDALLAVSGLNVSYGAVHALKGVDFHVRRGEIVSLIGSNGAGKTTTLRALSGTIPVRGTIRYRDRDLATVPAYRRVELGIAHSPEGRGLFPEMSVTENCLMGAYSRRDSDIAIDLDRCFDLFPRLKERRNQIAGTLSGGEQQMVAISRALMGRPDILLLDEPSLGLAPRIVVQIFDIIVQLNKDGMTVLLVEQNARMALRVSHRAYVVETGRTVLSGTGGELLTNDGVQRAYLGI